VADGRLGRASVRVRTTAAAVLVVAVALLVGAFLLVALVRESLRGGLETSAEQRAASLAAQVTAAGLPEPGPADEDEDDLDDLIWQVRDGRGTVVRSSQPLTRPLPAEESDEVRLPGADHAYTVATAASGDYRVAVAVSLEDVDNSISALVTPLAVGLPLLLGLVGATTWVIVSRALAPVERIRREVEEITGDRLDRRVPEPASRDEIRRMARTMNRMLARLETSRGRQQQFVADASHELRSPLASIRQAAEVAHAHPGAVDLTDVVLEESARMQRLVEQMLLLVRADDGTALSAHHDVDLDDLALTEARRTARSGVSVSTAGVGGGRVRGDANALGQVVRNLMDNAARHAKTSVTVAVRDVGDAVELTVEDDGAGVPEDQRERIFERFVRLDEARARDAGGSGLGLAIVREIVTAHGGTVTVSDGSRFVVRLPS
jgi:signal transduction histidine kinase